jgi:hypothetical protein
VTTTLKTTGGSEFVCSFCGKGKGDATDWLLGFEGSKEKSVVMKYTVTLLGKWDEERAREPNALHFCSTACQSKYVCRNYGDDTWSE